MMNKIRILLDYNCYPLWLYHEDGQMVNFMSPHFGLPNELNDVETRQLCDDIQHTYESLFTNNKIEFSYQGFANRADELIFMDKLERLVNIVTERVGDQYVVVNDIDEPWRR